MFWTLIFPCFSKYVFLFIGLYIVCPENNNWRPCYDHIVVKINLDEKKISLA